MFKINLHVYFLPFFYNMYNIFDTVLIQVFEQFEKRNVNMSRKYDSILLFMWLFLKTILCTIDFVAELRTNFWTRLYQKKYVTSKEHFLSKPIQKEIWNKKYVVFFSVSVLGKSLHNTTECKEFASTDTRVSTATYMFTVTRTWNMAAKLGKGGGHWSDEQPLSGNSTK